MDTIEQRFESDPQELARVREFVRATVAARGVEAAFSEFVVTEFATNAIVHAESDFTVRLGFTPSFLRIEVFDESDRAPLVGRHQPAIHGLEMVDRLVPHWGYTLDDAGGGKTVWAELTLRRSG